MKAAVRYSRELADAICAELAEGKSLTSICEGDDMPTSSAVRIWARDDVDGFFARYSRALEVGCDAIADELRHLTDGAKPEDAPLLHVKARVLIHLLSKWAPRKYGERPPMLPADLPAIQIQLVAPTMALPPAGETIEGEFREASDG